MKKDHTSPLTRNQEEINKALNDWGPGGVKSKEAFLKGKKRAERKDKRELEDLLVKMKGDIRRLNVKFEKLIGLKRRGVLVDRTSENAWKKMGFDVAFVALVEQMNILYTEFGRKLTDKLLKGIKSNGKR